MTEASLRPRFSLLVSGQGRGAQALMQRYAAGEINPELGVLVSTIADSQALRVAEQYGIPVAVITRKSFASKQEFEQALLAVLKQHSISYVFLSGYTYKVEATLLEPFSGCMLNVHPSLLPSFKGLRALQQALEYGVKIAGITVHYVSEEIDEGRIVLQAPVEVAENETFESLDAKVFPVGINLMVEAINRAFVAKS